MSEETKNLFHRENFCTCHPEAFEQLPEPLFRMVCHCLTCQEFFGNDYNDECTFYLKDCSNIRTETIAFKSYQSPLSPIRRGKCKACGKVACCIANLGPLGQLVMISSALIPAKTLLPQPVAHIYYHRRRAEADDASPKISGHLLSQAMIGRAVLQAVFNSKA